MFISDQLSGDPVLSLCVHVCHATLCEVYGCLLAVTDAVVCMRPRAALGTASCEPQAVLAGKKQKVCLEVYR